MPMPCLPDSFSAAPNRNRFWCARSGRRSLRSGCRTRSKIRRSISTGAIYNGILFYADFSGFLHALDVKTGTPFWAKSVATSASV